MSKHLLKPLSVSEHRNIECQIGCKGIKDPATTVPELVAFVRMVADYGHDEDCASYIGDECDCFSEKAIALLAKTGKT